MINKTKALEMVSFGTALMFGIYWIYSYFIKQHLSIDDRLKNVIGIFVLYIIGLGIFALIIRKIPNHKYQKTKISIKTILLCILLQFTSIWIFTVLINVSTAFGANHNITDINATSSYMLFMLLIFNPIMEEIVFRKLFADKLLKYGESFYMFASSFCFAIVHGVSLGVAQIIYTFILGMIWSYLMVKTGDLKLVIIMHALSNLFGSVIIQFLLNASLTAAVIYSMLLMLLGIIGLILFILNNKKIVLDGNNGLVNKTVLKDVFTNKGVLFYAALTMTVYFIIN